MVVKENNYYPFGLKHKDYNNVVNGTEKAGDLDPVNRAKSDAIGVTPIITKRSKDATRANISVIMSRANKSKTLYKIKNYKLNKKN